MHRATWVVVVVNNGQNNLHGLCQSVGCNLYFYNLSLPNKLSSSVKITSLDISVPTGHGEITSSWFYTEPYTVINLARLCLTLGLLTHTLHMVKPQSSPPPPPEEEENKKHRQTREAAKKCSFTVSTLAFLFSCFIHSYEEMLAAQLRAQVEKHPEIHNSGDTRSLWACYANITGLNTEQELLGSSVSLELG